MPIQTYTPPSPVPSPPPFDASFASTVEFHFHFHGTEARLGHELDADDSSLPSRPSSPTRDWRLSLTANFIASTGDSGLRFLRDLPSHLLPFFTYRDVAVYALGGHVNLGPYYNAMYREWYPTRDRTVFRDGLLPGCGAPFFGSTIRVCFKESTPQLAGLFKDIVRWHFALLQHLHSLVPLFCTLRQGSRLLVRPGLTQAQLQALPAFPGRIDYMPIMRRTFSECFVLIEADWEDNGARLVIIDENMLRRILSSKCEGLTRDIDLEEQIKQVTSLEVGNKEERIGEVLGEPEVVDAKARIDYVSVWRGSLQDIMRAVVAGDESRKRGRREFNWLLEEWLGEGVNVGK